MFDSKERALEHRDAVVSVLEEQFDESAAWHCHPVLDGCIVRVNEPDVEPASEAFEADDFTVQILGESGDWVELKVKP